MLEKILHWSGITTSISAIAMSLLGFCIVTWLGPGIAMGISIYSGHTEPIFPIADPPWLSILPIILSIIALIMHKKHALMTWISFILALMAAAIELLHLLHLVDLAMK